MGKAAGGMREAATHGSEVVETLRTHALAEHVLLHGRRLVLGRVHPGRAGVAFPASGRTLTIDAAISTAENIWVPGHAWRHVSDGRYARPGRLVNQGTCRSQRRVFRTRVEIPVVGVDP